MVETLKRFETLDYKATATPMALNLKLVCHPNLGIVDVTIYKYKFGSLIHLMNMRSNICFAMNTLIQYMVELVYVHIVEAKHVVMYLKDTIEYGLIHVIDQRIFL